jgi:predicted metalloprotease with PDZ domain
VKQITSNAAAHQAGVQVGDELIAINSWRISTNVQLEQMLQNWLLKNTLIALNITINHKGVLSNVVLIPSVEKISYHCSITENEAAKTWLKGGNF